MIINNTVIAINNCGSEKIVAAAVIKKLKTVLFLIRNAIFAPFKESL